MKEPCVYIMANECRGTLYIGATSDLTQRVWQHKNKAMEGFSATYGLKRLVWFECHPTMEEAILREKAMKKWRRTWKIDAIESMNPEWRDLYPELL